MRLIACLLVAMLTACATTAPAPEVVPTLRLAPTALGRTLDLQQRVRVQVQGRPPVELLVLFEADAQSVQLAAIQAGQTVVRLRWDGRELTQHRAPGWPDAVDGARVLSDLQLVWWPAEAVRAALPAGWRLEDEPPSRRLLQGDRVVTDIRWLSPRRIQLDQPLAGYRLDIDTLNPETTP
jgi:hypothetical protein